VQLYAGAFFPGLMLAGLYIAYVILLAKFKPQLAPPLSAEERIVPLPPHNQAVADAIGRKALPALLSALKGRANLDVSAATILKQLVIVLLPAAVWFGSMGLVYKSVTKPPEQVDVSGLQEMGSVAAVEEEAVEGEKEQAEGVSEPPSEEEEDGAEGVKEPPAEGAKEPAAEKPAAAEKVETPPAPAVDAEPVPAPLSYWIVLAAGTAAVLFFYWIFDFARLEIFKMLLASFFPLAILILAVLGSIVFGLATPTEAAAVGSLGGILLAAAYGRLNLGVMKESVFLTAKTSAMVCWLFVGSSIFSAAFALLGGQEVIEKWVLSLDMTPVQFMILAQFIIFILGWPLEWTEIIVIFMPIFIPLLAHFNVDPLFFGLLVALNLQTAFLSPPVAMAAFYLKGVSPPHVTLNQIFAGMMPFMAIQVFALFLLYLFPDIGMWLPRALYGN
jgi:TRAP-type mannitol/chloroaromatic compound transport system permease large subunit